MRPWFIREDNVVPFPNKDTTVLRLPNVGQYPDFLTGVSDLQARVKQGTLSDTMYKKLYTELLHRFMRRESAETPWFLKEDVTAPIDQKIDQLTNLAKSDPKLQDYVKNVFQKVIDYANKALGQKQENLSEQPQVATASPDQMAVLLKSKLDDMIKKLGPTASDPKIKQYIEKQLNDIKAYAEKSGVATGLEKGRAELRDFLKTYNSTIVALTNKITSSEQAFVDANSYATGKTIKGEVATKKKTIDVLRQVINSIFTGELFKADRIADKGFQDKLVAFLNGAKEGIVDWGKILEAGKGKTAKIDQFIPAQYKEIYSLFRDQLMGARPPTTAGAWGPGEVGLILLGNPITKAGDSGDLQDSKTGVKFELKASNKSSKGGRLSPKGLSTSPTPKLFKTVKEKHIGANVLQKHFKDLGNKSYLAGENSYSLNQRFIRQLNELIDKGLKIDVSAFLTDAIIIAFTDNTPTEEELAPYVKKMIVGNKIDYDRFVKAYAKFLMVRYQGSGKDKKFEGILVFNPRTGSYTVLSSAKDLDYKGIEITGGIEFGGAQVPKSPQIGIS
jgi:hypothetical protein